MAIQPYQETARHMREWAMTELNQKRDSLEKKGKDFDTTNFIRGECAVLRKLITMLEDRNEPTI